MLISRIQKLYTKQKINEEDYLMLKPILKVRRNESPMKDASQAWVTRSMVKPSSSQKENMGSSSSLLVKCPEAQSFLPLISSSVSKYHRKKKFENIIIIKGRSITKK